MKTIKTTIALLISLSLVSISLVQFAYSQEKTGKEIFEGAKCNACHSVEKAGIEAKKKSDKVPDLSKLAEGHDADFFAKYLKKEETLNSKKHAVAFKGSDEELKTMVDWLMSLTSAE